MTAFIKQEALEKANEIKIKADEEFAIEKSKLVREENQSIDDEYTKKSKTANMSQQIAKSVCSNQFRLRVLDGKEQLLDRLFELAQEKLVKFVADKEKYKNLLVKLILEGAIPMNESRISLAVRKADLDLVNSLLRDVEKKYQEKTGNTLNIHTDHQRPLPEDSIGGVVVIGSNGKIEINNTLKERLKLLEEDALPTIRLTLFGANPNRKFFD